LIDVVVARLALVGVVAGSALIVVVAQLLSVVIAGNHCWLLLLHAWRLCSMLHTWCSFLSLQITTTIVLLYFGVFNGISCSLLSASRVVIP